MVRELVMVVTCEGASQLTFMVVIPRTATRTEALFWQGVWRRRGWLGKGLNQNAPRFTLGDHWRRWRATNSWGCCTSRDRR